MLTESDTERMNAIMQNVQMTRSLREESVVRDEARIAEILKNAEVRASEEHQLLLESRNAYSGYIGSGKSQTTVKQSGNLKRFPKVSDWKRRFTAASPPT